MTSMATSLLVLASDTIPHEEHNEAVPYLIGAGTLLLLLALLAAVVFFGGGREHS